jgi:hypothetical protein
MRAPWAWINILCLAGCPATVDTSPGDGGGGSTTTGVGAGALGEDALATTCEEVCGPIPGTASQGCRDLCEYDCEYGALDVELGDPCGPERADLITCYAKERYHTRVSLGLWGLHRGTDREADLRSNARAGRGRHRTVSTRGDRARAGQVPAFALLRRHPLPPNIPWFTAWLDNSPTGLNQQGQTLGFRL